MFFTALLAFKSLKAATASFQELTLSIPCNLLFSLRHKSHESRKVATIFSCGSSQIAQAKTATFPTTLSVLSTSRWLNFNPITQRPLSQNTKRKTSEGATDTSRRKLPLHSGLGQLSIVEHALCPLDRNASLHGERFNESSYRYSDQDGQRCTASVRVDYPLGLAASDELYLWGLLALTVSQPERSNELHATPHYCLKQLGALSTKGGKNYELFRAAIRRLSSVFYQNDGFYDPVRVEHRDVAFHFLSYSLPLDPGSSRTWRLVWNPIFFEMCTATGSTLMFDLATYRQLDEGSRRLFLLVKKMFWRRKETPRFDVRELATQVLGFSPELPQKILNQKVRGCIRRLAEFEIVDARDSVLEKRSKGVFAIRFRRGAYFSKSERSSNTLTVSESALIEPLTCIGLDSAAVTRILREYPHSVLREWADITLAARERFGDTFFKTSKQAYFIDNVKHAATGTRTAPDWWHDVRKAEERRVQAEHRSRRESETEQPEELSENQQAMFDQIAEQLFQQFRATGQSEMAARNSAVKLARQHVQNSSRSSTTNLRAIKP